MNGPPRFIFVVAAAALLVAVLHMPYGYYQLVRLGICGIGGWTAWSLWSSDRRGGATAFAVCALVYNPVFLVHFDRETWQGINVAAAVLFMLAAWLGSPQATPADAIIDVPARRRDRIE